MVTPGTAVLGMARAAARDESWRHEPQAVAGGRGNHRPDAGQDLVFCATLVVVRFIAT